MTRLSIVLVGVTLAASAALPHAAQTEWKYAALGDSLATGYLAQAGYVPRYQALLDGDNLTTSMLYNLAQNGATSARLVTMLRSDPVVQSAVATSDVLTWNIGLNDFRSARTRYQNRKCGGKDNQDCLRAMLATFRSNWNAAVVEILSRRDISLTVMRTMDIYNPWVAADASKNTTADTNEKGVARGTDLQVLKYYLDQMNAEIASSADAHVIPYARVYLAFNGPDGLVDPGANGYLASDGLHPSEAGHAVMAQLLRELGYAPLR